MNLNSCKALVAFVILSDQIAGTTARLWTDFQIRIFDNDGRLREAQEDINVDNTGRPSQALSPRPTHMPTDWPNESPRVDSSMEPSHFRSSAPSLRPSLSEEKPVPSSSPLRSPIPQRATTAPSHAPTSAPTRKFGLPPTSGPTEAPTTRAENEKENGGCSGEDEFLFALFMYDEIGDGWDKSRIAILREDFRTKEIIFKGGLDDGTVGVEYLCLRAFTCYNAVIRGGIWKREIRWEIKPAVLGRRGEFKWAIARGLAPVDCAFSFGDNKAPACETTCLSWTREETVRTPPPTMDVASPLPSLTPTFRPTALPTRATTLLVTANPTLKPSKGLA